MKQNANKPQILRFRNGVEYNKIEISAVFYWLVLLHSFNLSMKL